MSGRPELAELLIEGKGEAWAELLGLPLSGDAVEVSSVRLRFRPGGKRIRSWGLRGLAGPAAVDGLAAHVPRPAGATAPAVAAAVAPAAGPVRLDHLVVVTPDFSRTAAALAAAGLPLKREQTLTRGGRSVRQGFRRLGEPILELVHSGDVPPGPARFWGLGFAVPSLEALRERLGDRLGDVRQAVQPGRRIATLSPGAGVDVPVAFMD